MSSAMLAFRFRTGIRRLGIIGATCAIALALVGCNTIRFGYSQGTELTYWWLDGYVDFNETQSPQVREALAGWFAWHRRTQLPDYAVLLEGVGTQLRADATPAQACRWFDDIRQRTDTAIERALPPLADLALSLTPAQLDTLQRQFRRKNDDLRDEFLQSDPQRRLRASVDRAVARFERIYGRLDAPQRAAIARQVAASPFDAERWLGEREARQREVLQLLRRLQAERPGREQTVELLRPLAQRMQQSTDDGYRAYAQRLRSFNCSVAAEVHNATTTAQRESAIQRIRGWAEDARVLAGVPASPVRAAQAEPSAAIR
jgi:hypothetical protein